MAIDAASILTMVQVARIVNDTIAAYAEGDLTPDQLDDAWRRINRESASARAAWEASKSSAAAGERRGG